MPLPAAPIAISEALRLGRAFLEEKKIENASLDARLLLQAAGDLSHANIIAEPGDLLPESKIGLFNDLLTRRASGEPVSRIIGRREFWSMDFIISPDVLDPRPDSETLIEAALGLVADRGQPLRVLDLGTGSGCLLIALLSELPNATGIGVDISEEALLIARQNASAHHMADRVEFLCSIWTDALPDAQFDLILSNPPYIEAGEIEALSEEVRTHDPRQALDGGADGLEAYRAIAGILNKSLTPKGCVVLEVGAGQAADVAALVAAQLDGPINIHQDLSGIDRCVSARA